jgi:four helix bundle protein
MTGDEIKVRTKELALRIMRLVNFLPNTRSGRAIGNQLTRSGTSVGANYRAACRARSKPEFLAKLGIVEEEADETCYWLELIIDGDLIPKHRVDPLLAEANELTAIIVASIKTARLNHHSQNRNPKSEIQ